MQAVIILTQYHSVLGTEDRGKAVGKKIEDSLFFLSPLPTIIRLKQEKNNINKNFKITQVTTPIMRLFTVDQILYVPLSCSKKRSSESVSLVL